MVMFQKQIDEAKRYREGRRVRCMADWDGFAGCWYALVILDGQSVHTTGYADSAEDALGPAWEWANWSDDMSAAVAEDEALFGKG